MIQRCLSAWLLFWNIIIRGDITTLRLMVSMGSIIWFVWSMLQYLFPETYIDNQILFSNVNIHWWSAAFLAHGFLSMGLLLTQSENKRLWVLTSIVGAMLWSISLNLVIASRIIVGVLPMASSAHWIVAMMAWWILLRDSYGK